MRAVFEEFDLDLDKRELSRAGEALHLSPKALVLLELLLKSAPRAVSKEELYRTLWGDTFVAEANIPSLVFEVRSALGDDKTRPRFVKTVHRFGYRFTGNVRWEKEPRQPLTSQRARSRIVWGARDFTLAAGEHVLGRDPDASVSIDSAGVSRHHARLLLSEDRAILEDLGSKNGTYLRGKRISGPADLHDGESFQLGSVALTFRRESDRDTLTEAVSPPVRS
jgi:DNA-binding winged helix-turn-helix (wHTH) protein